MGIGPGPGLEAGAALLLRGGAALLGTVLLQRSARVVACPHVSALNTLVQPLPALLVNGDGQILGSALPSMRAVHPDATIETEVIGEVAGLVPTDRNEARRILSELTGANSADVVPFGTEAGIFQSLGTDVVVCGPGSIEQAHKADEYLSLDQLDQCLGLLRNLGRRLTG